MHRPQQRRVGDVSLVKPDSEGTPTKLGVMLKNNVEEPEEMETLESWLDFEELQKSYEEYLGSCPDAVNMSESKIRDHAQRCLVVSRLFLVNSPVNPALFAESRQRILEVMFAKDPTYALFLTF